MICETYHEETMEWRRVKTRGPSPLSRTGHAAAVAGSTLYIMGGMSITPTGPVALDDLHALDTGLYEVAFY